MSDSNHDAVTVVVSCFNYGAYLHDAIGSLKSQDGGSPQVILVAHHFPASDVRHGPAARGLMWTRSAASARDA